MARRFPRHTSGWKSLSHLNRCAVGVLGGDENAGMFRDQRKGKHAAFEKAVLHPEFDRAFPGRSRDGLRCRQRCSGAVGRKRGIVTRVSTAATGDRGVSRESGRSRQGSFLDSTGLTRKIGLRSGVGDNRAGQSRRARLRSAGGHAVSRRWTPPAAHPA